MDSRSQFAGRPGGAADPLVSVVLAAFNAETHLRATCESILNQTYKALEIVIVDDGSTDSTAAIARDFARRDDRVRVIQQDNRGVAAARNRGIAEAKGVFVAPIDADDLWHPKKIERQVRRFQQCSPETGLVYCWWAWIDHHDRLLDRSPCWRLEGSVHRALAQVNFVGPASLPLYRKSCVQEVGGYDVTLRSRGCEGCEDWDLSLKVAERRAVAVVPAVLVSYRRHPDAMSANYQAMWRSYTRVLEAYVARQPGVTARDLRRSEGQFALHLAGVAFWSGAYLEACAWAFRVRSLPLLVPVLPYALRAVARRLLGRGPIRPVPSEQSGRDELASPPVPLIPYDRIHAELARSVAGSQHVTRPDAENVPSPEAELTKIGA